MIVVGALFGAATGLVYAYSLDPFCDGAHDVFVCYSSFFGWEIAELAAIALWTGLGAVMSGLVGLAISRVTRRS